MVRTGLSGTRRLGYRPAVTQDPDVDVLGGSSRPWSPEAAMEPVPPLAPPPARPGAGRTVVPAPQATTAQEGRRALLLLLVLVLVALVVLIVVVRV